ncbi:MAG: hypothetical protein ACTSUR_02900 [Candidatus Heimdallarchaeaceae archaeon]
MSAEEMVKRILGKRAGNEGIFSRIKKFLEGCIEEIKRFKPCS